MERLEHEGDQITHDILARLHRSFITPIDREDIHLLASALDDVMDFIEATTERFVICRVSQPNSHAKALAQVILKQVEEIHQIMPQLRRLREDNILQHCIEINRLENEGDRHFEGSGGRTVYFSGRPARGDKVARDLRLDGNGHGQE